METGGRKKTEGIENEMAHHMGDGSSFDTVSEAEAVRRKREKRTLYYIGLGLLAVSAGILIVSRISGFSVSNFLLPCLFHSLTGYYCPGCGGTRAVAGLLHGNILESLYYHPFVVYAAAVYVVFMVTNTVEIISRGRWKIGMEFRHRYVYIGIVIVAANFIVKNAVLLFGGYAMIG